MKITTIGLDLAKNVIQVHGIDEQGKVVLRKQLKRHQMTLFFSNLPTCWVGMEACSSAHHWARQLVKLGHRVRLMAPQFVKPYVKTNNNDEADAEAIYEAVSRPNMRFVPIKNGEQQAVLALHRARQGFVKARMAQANQIRGLLGEYGFVAPQGIVHIAKCLPAFLEDGENELPGIFRQLLARLGEHLLVATIGDARQFENARQLAAWLGLVHRQHSSGGKPMLLGISKRGDSYLRTLLIHGARSVVRVTKCDGDEEKSWLAQLIGRRHKNVAAVALANKNARIVWALLVHDRQYQVDYVSSAA